MKSLEAYQKIVEENAYLSQYKFKSPSIMEVDDMGRTG